MTSDEAKKANVSQCGTPRNILDLTAPPEKYFGLKKRKFKTRFAKWIPSGMRMSQNGEVLQAGTQKTAEHSEEAATNLMAFAIAETGGQIQR